MARRRTHARSRRRGRWCPTTSRVTCFWISAWIWLSMCWTIAASAGVTVEAPARADDEVIEVAEQEVEQDQGRVAVPPAHARSSHPPRDAFESASTALRPLRVPWSPSWSAELGVVARAARHRDGDIAAQAHAHMAMHDRDVVAVMRGVLDQEEGADHAGVGGAAEDMDVRVRAARRQVHDQAALPEIQAQAAGAVLGHAADGHRGMGRQQHGAACAARELDARDMVAGLHAGAVSEIARRLDAVASGLVRDGSDLRGAERGAGGERHEQECSEAHGCLAGGCVDHQVAVMRPPTCSRS